MRELAARVADRRVVAAMAAVPRERFVPERLRGQAWTDGPLPIPEGQTISQPFVVARMCELLELRGGERVLDVGTGSGYHAAVLAALAGEVVSIERHAVLAERARRTLEALGVRNVEVLVGDGSRGHEPRAPYDAINVAAAVAGTRPPRALEDQLADGGRLVVPVGEAEQHVVRVRRVGSRLVRERLEPVRFVPLVGGCAP